LALLYLHRYVDGWRHMTMEETEAAFREVYPRYNPGAGMREAVRRAWDKE
jgi:hypothetical protein